MNKSIAIYNNFPSWFRNSLKYGYSLIPLRVRLGKRFFRQLEFLEKSQWWSKQELENYQNEQLQKLILHSYGNVPYYRQLFKLNKLTPKDIKTIYDLPKIPMLTKNIIRNNPHLLRADNFNDKDVIKLSTSGTTGQPLILYYDKAKEYLNYDPYIWRFFKWGGHNIGKLHATFSCWTMQGVYNYNPIRNFLILSAYKLNAENSCQYAEVMEKYKIKYLDTYPSAIELLTLFLKEKNAKPPVSLKAVFCHSECLSLWQRRNIEAFWNTRCFDWYGMEERVILAVECEKHKGLHLCSDFAITEFIDDKATRSKKIIATSLTNYAMPFIRYDTEDAGILNSKECSCGRKFPLFTLEGGRNKSFAIGKDGSYIPVVNVDIPNVSDNVLRFQFVQEKYGKLLLNIIKKDTFRNSDLEKIKAKLNEKFGGNMDVAINFTNTIEQGDSGKTLIFIQKMNEVIENGDALHS